MTREFPSPVVRSAALVLLSLMSISVTAFVAPTRAAPSQDPASRSGRGNPSLARPVDPGATPRFAYSGLDQATTTVTKTICPNQTTCAGGGNTTTLNPGQLVSFLITVTNAQRNPVTITDF